MDTDKHKCGMVVGTPPRGVRGGFVETAPPEGRNKFSLFSLNFFSGKSKGDTMIT